MSTIGSKRIVEDIIAGEYKHDDWIKIVEYTDQGNKRTWGCVAQRDDDPDRYERVTQWVRDPVVIWRKKKAMTPGKQLILGLIVLLIFIFSLPLFIRTFSDWWCYNLPESKECKR